MTYCFIQKILFLTPFVFYLHVRLILTALIVIASLMVSQRDECIEWQVNYGYQRFHEILIKIQNKHQKLPFSLHSIHDQNTIFIEISHIAKSNRHKTIFVSTQTKTQSIQCIYCQFNY